MHSTNVSKNNSSRRAPSQSTRVSKEGNLTNRDQSYAYPEKYSPQPRRGILNYNSPGEGRWISGGVRGELQTARGTKQEMTFDEDSWGSDGGDDGCDKHDTPRPQDAVGTRVRERRQLPVSWHRGRLWCMLRNSSDAMLPFARWMGTAC